MVAPSETKRSVLILISKQSLHRETVANQEKAYTVLAANGINFDAIDGADPVNKDRRNELFDISGIRGKYPQFFLVKDDGSVTFWGDWELFSNTNEAGAIRTELGGGSSKIESVKKADTAMPAKESQKTASPEIPSLENSAADEVADKQNNCGCVIM